MRNFLLLSASLTTFLSVANAATANFHVVSSQQVVQQELSVPNFGSLCTPTAQYDTEAPSCFIYNYNLNFPPGGKIVGAKTDSEIVRISGNESSYGVKLTFWPNHPNVVNGGSAQEKDDIRSGVKFGQIKVNLIYQGPSLK